MTAFEIYQSKQNSLHYVAIEEGDSARTRRACARARTCNS
jgi:hypothetical protein